ncbi:MAG: twin-arginine translocation signal domain-containing protein, partial [Phycisphaerales bacterium]|nr:twin-arginine translocation signal domain-containing protein [Phycisphaerales bacterium]
MSRRSFLRGSLGAAGGAAALAAALSPLRMLDTEDYTVEKFLQKHYKEMTPGEMTSVLDRIRGEVEERYAIRPELRDIKAQDGVEFVYALHLGRCIGCRRCVHACVQ